MDATYRAVDVVALGDTIGTPPTPRMRRSIRRIGVVQPVLLAEITSADGGTELRIIDGNRRVAAARAVRIAQIPAIVLAGLADEEIAQLTLTANGFRTANYLTEFWAIKQLERAKYTETQLTDISGLSSATRVTRNLLRDLRRPLFVALRNGTLPQHLAIAAAKLPPDTQEELEQIFVRRGLLTMKNIQRVAQRRNLRDARSPYVTRPGAVDQRSIPPDGSAESPALPTAMAAVALQSPATPAEPVGLIPHLVAAVRAGRAMALSREEFLDRAAEEWDALDHEGGSDALTSDAPNATLTVAG